MIILYILIITIEIYDVRKRDREERVKMERDVWTTSLLYSLYIILNYITYITLYL